MSIRSVTAPILSNPVGVDAKIQQIQLQLIASLPWLECSYGKALIKKDEKIRDEIGGDVVQDDLDIYTIPKVYIGDREWLSLEPNDEVDAFSFMYESNPEETISRQRRRSKINLVVFANTERIGTSDTLFIEDLKEQVLSVLEDNTLGIRNFIIDDNLTVYKELDDTWSEFTFPLDRGRWLKENYITFRIQFDIAYLTTCTPATTGFSVLLEDGVSFLLLESGDKILLE